MDRELVGEIRVESHVHHDRRAELRRALESVEGITLGPGESQDSLRIYDSEDEVERLVHEFEEYLHAAHGYDRANADTVVGDLKKAAEHAANGTLDEFLPYPERLDL